MKFSADDVYEVRRAMSKQEGRLVRQKDCADIVGVSRRTWIRWEQRGIPWNCDYFKQRAFEKLRDDVLAE